MSTFSFLSSKKNLIFISSLRILIGIFPIVGNLYVGRFLNEEDFGDYFLFYFLANLFLNFYGLNVHSAYRRNNASKSEKIKIYGFISSLFYLTLIAICNTVVIFSVYYFFLDLISVEEKYIWTIAFFCYASVFLSMFESLSILRESFKFLIITVIFPVILSWIFSIFFLQYTEMWLDRYLSFSIFIIFYLLVFLFYRRSEFTTFIKHFDYIIKKGRKFLEVSISLVIPIFLIAGFNYFDKLILDLYLDDFEFGQTSLVLQFAMIPFMAFKVIEMIYEKIMFEKYSQLQIPRRIWFHFTSYTLMQFLAALLLIFLMQVVFDFIYLKQLTLDGSTIFLLSLLQMSKLSLNFLIIFFLLTGKQNYALGHVFLFFTMWGVSIVLADTMQQYIGYTIVVTYVSVVLAMLLIFFQRGIFSVVSKKN